MKQTLVHTIAAATLLAAVASAQLTHTIPNGYANQVGNTNNAFPWGTGVASWPGLRTQCIYDGVEFTGANINVPILIQRLKWRSAAGAGTWTGTTFNSAVVNMCTSPTLAANVQANFAAQQGTDWAQVYNGPVTSLGGTGQMQTVVDLTLQTPFLYNPTSGPLVIDVDLTMGHTGGSHPQLDVASPITCSRVWSSNLYPAPNGAWTSHGVIVEVSYVPAANYAYTASVGVGCGSTAASFYEMFATPASFDLNAGGLSMINSSGSNLVLTPLSPYVPPSAAAMVLPLGDDSEAPVTLSTPFTFNGQTTSSLMVCSNGFVSMAGGNGVTYTPVVGTMLNAPQTGWWTWHDLNPTIAGSGQVKYEEVGSLSIVTYDGVYSFGTTTPNTMQFQFDRSTGMVHIHWVAMSGVGNGVLVGFSPGGSSMDPGGRDLSVDILATFTLAATDQPALSHSASTRPVLGTMATLNVNNIPAAASLGMIVVSPTPLNFDLTGLGAPGCWVYQGLDIQLPFVPLGPTHSMSLGVPNIAALAGVHYFSQAGAYATVNPLGVITSNGLDHKLDIN